MAEGGTTHIVSGVLASSPCESPSQPFCRHLLTRPARFAGGLASIRVGSAISTLTVLNLVARILNWQGGS